MKEGEKINYTLGSLDVVCMIVRGRSVAGPGIKVGKNESVDSDFLSRSVNSIVKSST